MPLQLRISLEPGKTHVACAGKGRHRISAIGKMMDFLQEDVDSMQRELDKWRTENKEMTQQIRSEME